MPRVDFGGVVNAAIFLRIEFRGTDINQPTNRIHVIGYKIMYRIYREGICLLR